MKNTILELTFNNKTFVIREWNEQTPFVVHQKLDDGSYYQGDYCQTIDEAVSILNERAGTNILNEGEL